MGVDPVSLGVESAVAAPALEGASKGAEAAGALAPAAAAAAPEAAAGTAGALALPEIEVTAPALAEAGTAGAGAAAGTAAATGAGAGEAAGGAGLAGLLGINAAQAGGLNSNSVVPGEFNALPDTAQTGTTPYKIGSSPFVGGPVPLPTAAPGIGGGSPLSPGSAPASTIQPDSTDIGQSGGPAAGTALNQFEGNVLTDANPPGPGVITPPASGGAGNFLSNNKGLLALLGLGVGGQLLSPAISNALGLNKVPGSQNLQALAQQESQLAGQQNKYGQTLEQPLITGQLPAGQQQAVTNALNDAIATIKGRYGSLGLSGSSMEAEAIANAQNRSTEVAAGIEQQMAQTGAQAVSSATTNLGLESQIYDTLLNATIQQDQLLGQSVSRFASAVGTGAALKTGFSGIG